jgi:hypothetical protein
MGGQAFEKKQFREMTDFAPQMISMTCDRSAKRFISLWETIPFAFAGFSAGMTGSGFA